MSERESVALICHESQLLRLRGAELESRATHTKQELEEALARRRALMERLRETQKSISRMINDGAQRGPGDDGQRGSAK